MRLAAAPLLSCVAPRCSAGCVMTGTSGPLVGVESQPPTPQSQHQSQEQRRVIQRHRQRRDEHRSASQDAEPAPRGRRRACCVSRDARAGGYAPRRGLTTPRFLYARRSRSDAGGERALFGDGGGLLPGYLLVPIHHLPSLSVAEDAVELKPVARGWRAPTTTDRY
jgi:hypothetical protein